MDNATKLEAKWDLLDENEQKMVDSYMDNLLTSPDKMVLNLDDFPARKKLAAANPPILVNPEYTQQLPEVEEKVAETPVHSVSQVEEIPVPPPVEHKEANPAPLGLLGFGMTTCLLNIHNAGYFEMSVMILAMGIAMGGLAQVIAGIMEFKNKNTFGATAFTSYGLFWWSLVIILTNPSLLSANSADSFAMGCYMAFWCLFTFFMYIGTLKLNVSMRLIFGTLALLFFLLAVENFTGNSSIGLIAGYEGIFCGAIAIYTALANVLNEVYGKTVMPV